VTAAVRVIAEIIDTAPTMIAIVIVIIIVTVTAVIVTGVTIATVTTGVIAIANAKFLPG
jgi:hypothetical protein